jgi:hypothetical protein
MKQSIMIARNDNLVAVRHRGDEVIEVLDRGQVTAIADITYN